MRSRCSAWPAIYPGVQVQDWMSAAIAALVLGLVNTLVKPVLVILTLPVTILTLGLFLVVLNALLFWGVSEVVPGFHVDGLLGRRCSARSSTASSAGCFPILIPDRKQR